jgi:DNA-binding HxlR family transcriptional regulator
MGGHRNVTTYAESVIGTSSPLPSFDPACPMSAFPIQIGGKWTAMVVLCLEDGPRRFGVLRRHLRPISAKVLAETLAAMGRDGLVQRCPAEGDDGGVEYELTSLGRTLLDVIEHARGWARCHLGELMRARDEFDRAGPTQPMATLIDGTREV